MRALICREWGDIGRLKVEDVAAPKPGAGQVLIDVKATAATRRSRRCRSVPGSKRRAWWWRAETA